MLSVLLPCEEFPAILVVLLLNTGWSDSVPGTHWQLCSGRGGQDRHGGPDLHPHPDQGVHFSGPLHLHD